MSKLIVGVDEAGRGPLAGPVIAAAITVLGNLKLQDSNHKQSSKLKDSKLLSPKQRNIIYTELYQNSDVVWGVGSVSERQIDKINIFQATRLAMKKAVISLQRKLYETEPRTIIKLLIVDGNMLLDLPISQKAIPKADTFIWQCMAASVVAKVTRDRLMLGYHKLYPQYGFDRHKGYGTKHHFEMLKKYGPSPIHRMSFAPCKQHSELI